MIARSALQRLEIVHLFTKQAHLVSEYDLMYQQFTLGWLSWLARTASNRMVENSILSSGTCLFAFPLLRSCVSLLLPPLRVGRIALCVAVDIKRSLDDSSLDFLIHSH